MTTAKEFQGPRPTWCAGCGDFAVLSSLQTALAELDFQPHQVCVVSGIGCSGKISQHLSCYGFHALHGRAVPVATGVKLANQDLAVICAGGDGDGYGIGLSHSLHAMRRNIDITYIVMDNNIYGLTTGQLSPTSQKGFQSKTSPSGSAEDPIRPLELALAAGCSFVAQAFSGEPKELTRIYKEAIAHRGFSLINVFSPCVTFNKINTYEFFRENLKRAEEMEGYDPADRIEAIRISAETGSLVTGILYREERPVYHEAMVGRSQIPTAHLDIALPPPEQEALLAQFG